jgi:hypothetical protein
MMAMTVTICCLVGQGKNIYSEFKMRRKHTPPLTGIKNVPFIHFVLLDKFSLNHMLNFHLADTIAVSPLESKLKRKCKMPISFLIVLQIGVPLFRRDAEPYLAYIYTCLAIA